MSISIRCNQSFVEHRLQVRPDVTLEVNRFFGLLLLLTV